MDVGSEVMGVVHEARNAYSSGAPDFTLLKGFTSFPNPYRMWSCAYIWAFPERVCHGFMTENIDLWLRLSLVPVSIAGVLLTHLSSFIFFMLICQHCCCGVGIIAIVGSHFGVCQHRRSNVDIVLIISFIFIITLILSYGLIILLTTFTLCYRS